MLCLEAIPIPIKTEDISSWPSSIPQPAALFASDDFGEILDGDLNGDIGTSSLLLASPLFQILPEK